MKQGLLGDCWFLCACAALQKSRHLLEQVSAAGRASRLPVCRARGGSGRPGSRRLCAAGLRFGRSVWAMGLSLAPRPQGRRGAEALSPRPQGLSGVPSALLPWVLV